MRTDRRHLRRESPATLRLHVSLEGAFPPVWRRIEVASDLGLDDLHDVLQVVFGWEDYHLHRFTTGPQDDPGAAFACTPDLAEGWDDDPSLPTWDVRVDELLAEVGERLHYQYDYGDNWWLVLEVEDVVDGRVPPGRAALVEGAGAGPPEDCGGISGYRMIVAAADPAHPDHRQALADLGDWWGYEPAPDALGLVAFDPATIGERLQASDLAGRPPVPRHVGEKLTAAGYLPPAVVVTIFDELDLGDEWIGKGNREDLTVPVLELREAGQRFGLLRKYKGKLLPTARARTLADDLVGLWWHLAGRLPLGGRKPSDVQWQAGVLLLALMASGETDDAEVMVARLLSGMGWALEGGVPVDRRAAGGLIAQDVHLLHRLGALDRDRHGGWPGTVTTGGAALARAALADQHS